MSIGGVVIGHVEYNAPSYRATLFSDSGDVVGEFEHLDTAMDWLGRLLP